MTRTNFRRILCAVDFSEFSRRALEHAVALARWSGARLAVVHAVDSPSWLLGASPFDAAARERRLEALRRFAEPVMGFFAARLVLREGSTAREIAAESVGWGADLVVVGTHGRRGLEHWEMGSVAEEVIRAAPCPVLTVPRHSRPPRSPGEPPFRSVLCALDLGPSSTSTLEYALALALRARARVSVLHAMEDLPEDPYRMRLRLGGRRSGEYRGAVETEARARLRQLLPDEVRAACAVDEIVVPGRARRQIVRLAGQKEADLVVMGVHSARPLQLPWFGSTAAAVVRAATCPVLTMPARARARLPTPGQVDSRRRTPVFEAAANEPGVA